MGQGWSKNKNVMTDSTVKHTYSVDEIFCENSLVRSSRVRELILKNNLKDYKCGLCGIVSWNDSSILLQLHHINGDRYDHRLENLEFLCPNCHSQTDNFCSKNVAHKNFKKATDDDIMNILTSGNFTNIHDIISYLGYSDKNPNIRKRIRAMSKTLNIEIPIIRPKRFSDSRFCECGNELSSCQHKYCSYECKNKYTRVSERPTKDELVVLINTMSMLAIGRKFGVSDNAVRKWCKYYEISKSS